jgi:S-adenosylmethionine:diacylglycerol 3-amino-3-carboxypropyl transferase
MIIPTNLPTIIENQTESKEIRQFFNSYYTEEISFPSNLIDAVIGFFTNRGFEEQVARSTSIVFLNQARLDNVNVFELLDKLNILSDVQLTKIITQILNAYRIQTSVLGYKSTKKDESFESRNILI